MMNGEGAARLDNATAELSGSLFTGKADLNSLFSDNRYIRLQCEYKEQDVKNFEHIQWHKNQVYRDISLKDGAGEGHIENLKKSLKGTHWADGSYVDDSGEPHDPPSVASLTSQVIIPGKREFE